MESSSQADTHYSVHNATTWGWSQAPGHFFVWCDVQKGPWNSQFLDSSFILWEPEPWLHGTQQGSLCCPLEAAGSLKATSIFVSHSWDPYWFTFSLKKNWNSIVIITYLKNVGFSARIMAKKKKQQTNIKSVQDHESSNGSVGFWHSVLWSFVMLSLGIYIKK